MLDGQGGDEVLAGYRTTYGYRLADLLAGGRLRRVVARAARLPGARAGAARSRASRRSCPRACGGPYAAKRGRGDLLVHPSLAHPDVAAAAAGGGRMPDRLRSQYHLILSQLGLPELLRYEDRNSMAHSLEGRVPFLDHRLVELLYGLDAAPALRARHDEDRAPPRALRICCRRPCGHGGQARLRHARAAFLPRAARRPRRGGVRSPELRERGLVDGDEALERLRSHRAGSPAGFELWRALSVELWARRYLG